MTHIITGDCRDSRVLYRRLLAAAAIWLYLAVIGNSSAQTNVFPASGNVGIGTTSPVRTLFVSGTAGIDSTSDSALRFYRSGTEVGEVGSDSGASTLAIGAIPNDLVLRPASTGNFRITDLGGNIKTSFLNNGDVGIGTTNPLRHLDIWGGGTNASLAITNTAGVAYLLMGNQDSAGVNAPAMIGAANGGVFIGHGSDWSSNTGGVMTNGLLVSQSGGVSLGSYANGFVDPGANNLVMPGNVGIGTNAPGVALDVIGQMRSSGGLAYQTGDGVPWWVAGTGNGPAILLQKNTVAGGPTNRRGSLGWMDNNGVKSETLTWTDSGFVGIGTSSPLSPLHVLNSGTSVLSLQGVGPGRAQIQLYSDTGANGGAIQGFPSDFYVDLAPGQNFSITPDGGGTHNLRVLNNGNVGIGTSAPTAPLQVYRSAQPEMRLQSSNRSWSILQNTAWGASGFSIYDITADVSRLQIDVNGNVGINTITPHALLDVAGNTNISGNLNVGGTFSAVSYTASNGTIAGGAAGLTLNAGGTNQNVTLAPSGTGAVVVPAAAVGIGTSSPQGALQIGRIGMISNGASLGTGNQYAFYMGANYNFGAAGWEFLNGGLDANQMVFNSGAATTWDFNVADGTGKNAGDALTWTTALSIKSNGRIGIGTSSPDNPLTVKGRIHATEVVVDTAVAASDIRIRPQAWADDVLAPNHPLAPLSAVAQQIAATRHLPGIPSAQDVAANGVSVADMQVRLLEKIEELTLHQIQQEKEMRTLARENAELRTEVAQLQAEQK